MQKKEKRGEERGKERETRPWREDRSMGYDFGSCFL